MHFFVFCTEKNVDLPCSCLLFTENLLKLKLENAYVSEWLNFLSVFLAQINFKELKKISKVVIHSEMRINPFILTIQF